MQLELTFPDGWTLKHAPGEQFAAILPGAKLPTAIITGGPIRIKPDEPGAWMESVARGEVPAGAAVALGRSTERTTRAGWPLRLLEVEVRDANGQVIEHRLCAFFSFMEHVAAAIVRTGTREAIDTHGQAILDILGTGRPAWRQHVAVADYWDLESVAPAHRRARAADPEQLEALAAVGDADETAAQALQRGVALGALGRHAEALAAWTRALELAPDSVDARYNLGQAQFHLKDFDGALASFRAVVARAPDDALTVRKVIQCLYALDRFEEGFAERKRFRDLWTLARDPRAHLISEYVFDQFDAGDYAVHAIETLRPRDPKAYALLTFQAMRDDRPLPAAVVIETSPKAQQAGTPFVIGVSTSQRFEVVSLMAELPLHGMLRTEVRRLLDAALAPKP